jgi:hypothetical protein
MPEIPLKGEREKDYTLDPLETYLSEGVVTI